FKPMIDKILSEAGFPACSDALTSLTSALAQRKAEVAEAPTVGIESAPTAQVGTITGQLAPAPKQQ
ncbi:flotillin family protein, partial [Bradyrhizobium elkanii]|nr:flotillin family protein [Bradyrhizobium elkanii]